MNPDQTTTVDKVRHTGMTEGMAPDEWIAIDTLGHVLSRASTEAAVRQAAPNADGYFCGADLAPVTEYAPGTTAKAPQYFQNTTYPAMEPGGEAVQPKTARDASPAATTDSLNQPYDPSDHAIDDPVHGMTPLDDQGRPAMLAGAQGQRQKAALDASAPDGVNRAYDPESGKSPYVPPVPPDGAVENAFAGPGKPTGMEDTPPVAPEGLGADMVGTDTDQLKRDLDNLEAVEDKALAEALQPDDPVGSEFDPFDHDFDGKPGGSRRRTPPE